jgi:signal transduction histidine kinase/DNA-binding response OmpR family regulator
MQLKKLLKAFRARFEPPMDESIRDTFAGELEYECNKLFYVVFLGMFVWLPYISGDRELHQFPTFALWIRFGFSIISTVIFILRFTKLFHISASLLLKVFISYLYIGAGLIAATSGEAAVAYTGGFTFVIMCALIAPFSGKFKSALTISSIIIYLLAGSLTGMDFSSPYIGYALRDLMVAAVAFITLSHLLNIIRYKTWEQRKKLKNAITENEKNLSTIFNLANKAEASDRAKSEFLATMSHEIRTPLNAIMGIAQIKMQEQTMPDSGIDALEKIYSSGSNLLGIINDILDMSKIETGKLELHPIEYDLPSLINDAVQLNIIRIGSKPLEFNLDIDENLPSKLYGDELRIKQILNNLISNAIKYTEKGNVKLSFGFEITGSDINLRFTVEDTGQGMKPEDKARLFTEYSRFNIDENRTTEGTGLGLSITKRLVDMMDGTIEAESEYSKGSIFTVTVKQGLVADSPPIGAEITENLRRFAYRSEIMRERRKIVRNVMPYGSALVVDDVETNLFVAEGFLSPYKLQIETANSGFETIDKINDGKTYDIIFMDHMMPKMDGIETVAKLRKGGYTGAIVALTANALVGNGEMFTESGFDSFISKPIDVHRLDEILIKFICERYPEEAKKYSQEVVKHNQSGKINPKLIQVFLRDTKKAIVALREAIAAGDVKLFTTTAHAMKSALANVGEHEVSKVAAVLEREGFTSDTGAFIKMLEALVVKYKPAGTDESVSPQIDEDTAFLEAQLAIIKTACENYDAKAAYTALELLKEKSWKSETRAIIDEIHDLIYLSSDFDGAAEIIN